MQSSLANITKLLENLTTQMNDVKQEETLGTERLLTKLVIMDLALSLANLGLMIKMILRERTLRA